MKEPLGPRRRSPSVLSIVAVLAASAVLVQVACRSEDEPPASPIGSVADAVDVQEDLFEFQCQCYAQFLGLSEQECRDDPRGSYSEEERACLDAVFADDTESFEILRCEAEALRGLLECESAVGCPGEHVCDDGTVIADVWLCDEIDDCPDASDEGDECLTAMCADGERLPPSWICDEFPDCLDGSDEIGCPPSFVCDDGQQVPGSWVCDGVAHCLDASDEQQDCPETCEGRWVVQLANCGAIDEDVTASIGACLDFTCIDGMVIEAGRTCDGVDDCAEGEDESICDEGSGSGEGSGT